MLEKLKKDNFWLGFILGFLVPLVVYIILYFTDDYLGDKYQRPSIIKDSTKYLISVFFNIIMFQVYMVSWKMDKTGKGLVAITFILAFGYIILFHFMGTKYLF